MVPFRPCLWPGIMTPKKNSVESLSIDVVVVIYLVFFVFRYMFITSEQWCMLGLVYGLVL